MTIFTGRGFGSGAKLPSREQIDFLENKLTLFSKMAPREIFLPTRGSLAVRLKSLLKQYKELIGFYHPDLYIENKEACIIATRITQIINGAYSFRKKELAKEPDTADQAPPEADYLGRCRVDLKADAWVEELSVIWRHVWSSIIITTQGENPLVSFYRAYQNPRFSVIGYGCQKCSYFTSEREAEEVWTFERKENTSDSMVFWRVQGVHSMKVHGSLETHSLDFGDFKYGRGRPAYWGESSPPSAEKILEFFGEEIEDLPTYTCAGLLPL